jgi:tetratricopeptide (TPR) repeat protein
MPIAGLTDEAATQLAASLLPASASSAADVSRMVLRSDGVPLYLEELALALQQQRLPTTGEADAAFDRVPLSLRNLLTSRLDVLVQSREIAQFAAALGREFSLELLTALHDNEDLSLVSDLEELVSARILIKRLRLESPIYSFRHALIRDAAYESMSPESRRRSHELIADGLRLKFPNLADAQPDVLAHHYERSGMLHQAMQFWHLAAQRASAASAHVEAMAHVDRALAARNQLVDAAGVDSEEAGILLTRGAILVATRGYAGAAPDFERIIQLVPAEGPTLQLAFAARWGVWNFNNARCSLESSSQLADELRTLAAAASDSDLSLAAWAAICLSRFCTGRLDEAVAASRSCAAEYDLEKHRGLALRYGDDPHVSSGSFEALAELLRGRHELALLRVDEVMALIDQLGYPAQKAAMHGQAAWLFLQWGGAGASQPDYARALEHAQAAITMSQEHGFPFWELNGTLAQQAAKIASGDASAASALKACSDMWCSFGLSLGRCWHLTFLGQAYQRAGAWADASQAFDAALAFCEGNGSRFFEAESRRQRAVFLADQNNPQANLALALDECWKGAKDARAIGAHFWELACLVTGIRLSPERNPARFAELSSLIGSLPLGANEPPLLREARALAASA